MNLREIGTLYVELERHWTKIQALLKLEVSFRASNYHMSLSKCTWGSLTLSLDLSRVFLCPLEHK